MSDSNRERSPKGSPLLARVPAVQWPIPSRAEFSPGHAYRASHPTANRKPPPDRDSTNYLLCYRDSLDDALPTIIAVGLLPLLCEFLLVELQLDST